MLCSRKNGGLPTLRAPLRWWQKSEKKVAVPNRLAEKFERAPERRDETGAEMLPV